uniref:E3 ubiquitin-protein ligase n=1 Tax=Anopheles albimanus TaxID=7167 RepID=A0A182FJ46_ANOAL
MPGSPGSVLPLSNSTSIADNSHLKAVTGNLIRLSSAIVAVSLFYEILSGVWVRNGLQIKGQAMTYIQANFCNSMVDMDLFFLQICATQLPPNQFLSECIAIFGIEDWLGMSVLSTPPEMEQDSMLEGLLTFLATLITSRINLGNDETTQCIIEISALLATGDKTHSQLLELMPERSGNAHTRNFERFLKELSIYRSPLVGSENLEQGLFMPVPEVWEKHYDPLHVLLRAVHRRDFQNSLDRFGAYVKQQGKMPKSGNLWPPFRLPSPCGPAYSDPAAILSSRILHAIILAIFYRAVHTHNVSEHMLALAVFLLEMAVCTASAAGGEAATSHSAVGDATAGGGVDTADTGAFCRTTNKRSGTGGATFPHRGAGTEEGSIPDLLNCYPSNCLSDNLKMTVHRISLLPGMRRSPVSYHKSSDDGTTPPFDSDVEWDLSEDETLMMIGSSADMSGADLQGGWSAAQTGSNTVEQQRADEGERKLAMTATAATGAASSTIDATSTALVPARGALEVIPQDLTMAEQHKEVNPEQRIALISTSANSSTSQQMVVEEEGGNDEGKSASLRGGAVGSAVETAAHDAKGEDICNEELEDQEEYEVEDEDGLDTEELRRRCEARRRRRTWMLQGSRRSLSVDEAPQQQDEDIQYHVMDEDGDVIVEDQPMLLESNQRGNVHPSAHLSDSSANVNDNDDEADEDEEEAAMTAAIASITPRADTDRSAPRHSSSNLYLVQGQIRQHHQQRPHERALQNHHHHHRSPHGAGARGAGTTGSLIRASPSRASEFIVQEVATGTAPTGMELVIRHEFVSARDGRTGSSGLTGQEIAIPRGQTATVSTVFGTTGASSTLSSSGGAGSGSLLPFSRVQPVAVTSTDVSISDASIIGDRTDTNSGAIVPATTTAVASSQQNLLQNYYHPPAVATSETALASTMRPAGAPSGRLPHHHLHHHHMHHHHRHYHSHNSNPHSVTGSRQQQQTPESFQQHTPRHYHRSGLRSGGSSASITAGSGHSNYPQQWMRHSAARGGIATDNSAVAGAGTSAGGSASTRAGAVAGSSADVSGSAGASTDAGISTTPGIGSTRAGAGTSAEMAPRDGVVGLEAVLNDSGTVVLEESIISLLLKLHSQLSGALDSFSLEDEEDEEHVADQPKATSSASCNSSTAVGQMMELDEEEPSSTAVSEDTTNKVTGESGTSHKSRTNQDGCNRISGSRIGDGPFFIGNLLRRIAALDPSCVTRINEIRAQLWPNQRERQAEQKAREAREKEERTKRAKERQKKLMEEFANRQKRFMLLAMGGDPSSMDCFDDDEDDDDEDAKAAELQQQLLREKEYDCIICNTSGPSTESNPIGLVVLVESSSVVGHRRNTTERFALPLCAEDRTRLERNITLAGEYQKRFELLQWKFGQTSWFLSQNIGWEGGVHIQSCGHHVHLSCQDSYLKSLHTPRSPNNLNVELGEFFCPVCRQLANSVLPLSPALDRPAPLIRTPTPPHATLVLELIGLFQENKRTPMASKFCEAMGRAMGNITACTQRNIRKYPVTLQSLFSFVISIARTNLEAEVIQRGGSLCNTEDIRFKPKRDCIVPLLHVLSLHVRLMINDDWPIRFQVGDDWPWHSWSRLVGIQLAYGTNAAEERPTSSTAHQFEPADEPSANNALTESMAVSLAMAVVPAPPVPPRPTSIEDEDDEEEEYDEEDDENDGVEEEDGEQAVRMSDGVQRQMISNIHGMLIPSWTASHNENVGGGGAGMQIPSVSTNKTTKGVSKTTTTAAAASSLIIETETIPDFISDPTALMLKFILLAPLHLDQAYFTCIVKVMYNLLYYQVVLQLCTHLTEEECDLVIEQYGKSPPVVVRERGVPHIGAAMAFILNHLDRCKYIRSDSILMADSESVGDDTTVSAFSRGNNRIDLDVFEKRLQRLCLPFLRIAALLRHHIYHAEIPEIAAPHLEFARLVYYLELVTVSMDWDKFNASRALCFLPGTELALPKNWCDQLRNLRPTYESTRSLIVNQHMEWSQPKLLGLPREYERLFTYYHEQQCQKCQNVPKESSICLLCGTIVCIKQTCCKEQDCCEAVRHSISCGGGTGIFLVITSTYIIIIRGLRACLWGSLYLDDYDEEDRDLKRGKPLYLSEDRFNLLESQWLSHRFAHTKHNWVWHRDSL